MALGTFDDNGTLSYHSINILTQNPNKLKGKKYLDSDINDNDDLNNNVKIPYDEDEVISSQYASNRQGVLAQCMVTGAVLILTAGVGMPIGYSAILLPQLTAVNGTLYVDEAMGSWIASIHSLATPVGSLLAGPLVDAMGRRSTLQLAAVCMCIGWSLIGFATNVAIMLVGRFASGFGVGACSVAAQILLGEITDPGIRGFLVTIPMTAYSAGILLVYALGSALRWDTVAYCGTLLPAIGLVTLSMITESPAWLVRRGKISAAKKALLWLRGGDAKQVNIEMSVLEIRAKEDVAQKTLTMTLRERALVTRAKVLHPGVLKPLLIINIFFLLQVLSGTYLIVYYGIDLVRDIGRGNINNYAVAIMTALTRCIFCFASCILLLKMGRRTLAIVSTVGTAVFSLILAGYIQARHEDSYYDKYVIGMCVFGYVILNTIGLLTLPGMMIGELLPHRARGVGGGCTMFIYHLTLFAAAKVFPTVKTTVGMSGVLMIFGLSAVVEGVFVWLVLPETKNHTLQEIEDYFSAGNVLWIMSRKDQKQRLTTTDG